MCCGKALNLTVFFHVCFRPKINVKNISTAVGGEFLRVFSVFSGNRVISRNLNYYQ